MSNSYDDKKDFSGRFQVRISPDVHEDLFKFSTPINQSMNDILEMALIFSIRDNREKFQQFADDYLNGSVIVVEDNMPKAHLVRRNLLSFSHIDDNNVKIVIKLKIGSVWKKREIVADLTQNRGLLELLNSWATPKISS